MAAFPGCRECRHSRISPTWHVPARCGSGRFGYYIRNPAASRVSHAQDFNEQPGVTCRAVNLPTGKKQTSCMSYFTPLRPAYTHRLTLHCIGLCLLYAFMLSAAWADLHHALEVTLDPAEHALAVVDTISRDGTSGSLEFELHPGMSPEVATEGVRLVPLGVKMPASPDAGPAIC